MRADGSVDNLFCAMLQQTMVVCTKKTNWPIVQMDSVEFEATLVLDYHAGWTLVHFRRFLVHDPAVGR